MVSQADRETYRELLARSRRRPERYVLDRDFGDRSGGRKDVVQELNETKLNKYQSVVTNESVDGDRNHVWRYRNASFHHRADQPAAEHKKKINGDCKWVCV